MKTIEVELAVAKYFNPRQNLAIPNVSWGFNIHECDLLILTKSKFLYEVEIKISRADLIKDKDKGHKHKHKKIRKLYFAIPENMIKDIEHIPEHAGILTLHESKRHNIICKKYREARTNMTATAVSLEDSYKLARLGSLRIWTLKKKILHFMQYKEISSDLS